MPGARWVMTVPATQAAPDRQGRQQDDERDQEQVDGVGLAAARAAVGEIGGDHHDAGQNQPQNESAAARG